MPYKATNTKKFLDSRGLTYFSQQLNNYPDNTVIEAVVEGVQDALDEKLDAAQKGAANGVAPLDAAQKVPLANLSVMTGATNSAAGTSGLVPSSNAGDQNKFLKASGEWGIPAGTSIHQFVLDDMTNATGSYSHSTSLSAARATMKAVNIECSNPDAFLDAITITINNGSILLECNKVNGSSSILVTAVEGQTGEQLTVSQYAELVGKIGDITSLTTASKDSLTAAVNEIDSAQDTISSQLTNKIDKPVNVQEGKFLQTDSNGNAVWGDAASPTDVANAVTDWLEDNVPAGQTVTVDQSLTVSGAAADAKKTGDKITDLNAALKQSVKNIEPYEIKANKYFAPSNTISLTDFAYTNTKLYLISEDSWVEVSGKFKGIMNNIVVINDTTLSSYFDVILRVSSSTTNQDVDYKFFVPANKVVGISNWYENEVYVNIQNISDFILTPKALTDSMYNADTQMPRYKSYYGYIDPNGTIVKAGTYHYYLYPVNVGDVCHVETDIRGGLTYACFFDNSLSQVGDKLVCTQNTSIQHYSGAIVAPTTAKYIAVTEIDGQQTLVTVKSRISKCEEKGSADLSPSWSVLSGKYIDRDGNMQSMGTYNVYSHIAETNDEFVNVSGESMGFITILSIWENDSIVAKLLVSNNNTTPTEFDKLIFLRKGNEVRVTARVADETPSIKQLTDIIGLSILKNTISSIKAPHDAVSGATKVDLYDLTGKTINIVGDSMTAMGNSYVCSYVATKLGCTVRNYGYSGSAIAYKEGEEYPSFVKRIIDENHTYNYQDADIWVIWGGYNDCIRIDDIGNIYDSSETTLYGALKIIVQYLQLKQNMPTIMFITPCKVNSEGEKMESVIKAISDVAVNYGIPMLNLYNCSGLSANNYKSLTDDGLHLNEPGRNMVYSKIAKFIKNNS